jgi:hypothetical protein
MNKKLEALEKLAEQGLVFRMGDGCYVNGPSRGTGKTFNEIGHQTSLEEHGFSLVGIKEWRERQLAAGRPSSLDDFYRLHGICAECRCCGLQMTGWSGELQVPLWTICPECGGSGRVPPS